MWWPVREVARRSEAGPVGLDPRGNSIKSLIFEFQMNSDLGKTLRISTKRFRRNLDTEFS
jgi:hypothetical protein